MVVERPPRVHAHVRRARVLRVRRRVVAAARWHLRHRVGRLHAQSVGCAAAGRDMPGL